MGIEEGIGRQAAHSQHPIHHLAHAAERQGAVAAAGDSHRPEIKPGRCRGVQGLLMGDQPAAIGQR